MNWLERQVEKNPTKPAFYFGAKAWTFAEIATEVQQKCAFLATKINEKRVALLSNNSQDMYVSILALWQLNK